ncbi:sugar ABC transporter ATP-binding protein [Ensifer sp.]|uniref:sugar ABC transporter ATP-binding protein n=1 Tax=Ensifer sp. TaxID=1872086 RepID=UPI002898EDDC|nr:sugar ABC transporter ATP-binding protein [Ensifer sp.]
MPLLRIDGLAHAFGPTKALAGASLEIRSGEIVALMGANGAGKSTLVNVLAGTLAPDHGTMTLAGQSYAPRSPAEATDAGVVTVHQSTERVGAPGLTVADALLLQAYADRSAPFFLSRSAVRRKATAMLDNVGFELPLDRDFAELTAADRQLVAIARALSRRASLLILDEPTASISGRESERLYAILRRLRDEGLAILFISHRIADLNALADRAIVMRGGTVVGEFARPIDFDRAVETMIGRPLLTARPDARVAHGEPVLEMASVQLVAGSTPFDLKLHPGEVVAVTGVLGAGKSRLLQAIFGTRTLAAGAMRLDGRNYRPTTPADAINAGVFMAGEDRHRTSLMPSDWPGSALAPTVSLPHLPKWYPLGFLFGTRERQEAQRAIDTLGIKTSGPDAPMSSLSGGNQQKVILGRWNAEPSRVLLLDEPFQGVDVGARHDIITAIRASTDRATLIATSDPEEALEVADRILIIDHHTLTPALDAQRPAVAIEA